MRVVLLLVALCSVASADALDQKKTLDKVKACAAAEDLAPLGAIERIETIGKRGADTVLNLVGKKARGYAVFTDDGCFVVPVVGKPAAYAKGNFGNNATAAFALTSARCQDPATCRAVVSLKKDDQVLDLFVLNSLCENGITLAKRAVFAGRDSLELGCSTSGGADVGRTDYLLDAGSGILVQMLVVNAGIGWIQIDDNGPPKCQLRIPGGLKVVTAGAKPEIDVTSPATPEEADAAKIDFQSGGCDITVATRRFVLDKAGTSFVAKPGAPRVTTKKKFCQCSKR